MKPEPCIAEHPLAQKPYDRLVFVGPGVGGTPLYRVEGADNYIAGAKKALQKAFELYGGQCFYCCEKLKPQNLNQKSVSRDHVFPVSKGGCDLLHNLVIACSRCNRDKAADAIHDYRPRAAKAYLEALEQHVARCVRAAASTTSVT